MRVEGNTWALGSTDAREDTRAGGSAPQKVLYVLGFARSGTTVLGNLLDQIDGLTHVGEMFHLWNRILRPRRNFCGCGRAVPSCEFWAPVVKASLADVWPSDLPVGDSLTPGFESTHDRLRLEQAYATQRRAVRTYAVVRAVLARLAGGRHNLSEYSQLTQALYRRAAEAAGARVIVDTSKLAKSVVYLRSMSGIDPYFVHIVRDPRGSVLSRQRKRALTVGGRVRLNPRTTLADSMRWLRANAEAELLCRILAGDRYMRLPYEQFAAAPAATLRAITQFIGEPQTNIAFLNGSSATLRSNHTVCGNRNRFQTGDITLSVDNAWQKLLRRRDSFAIAALTAPALLRYRYPLHSTDAALQ